MINPSDIFGKILTTPNELPNLRQRWHRHQKIVFCSGSFDLLHLGHVYFFKYARELGDLLVASVGTDAVIRRKKGSQRPITSQDVRVQMVAAVRFVDYCFLDDEPVDEHPLATLRTNLKLLRPDIYAVNSDGFDLEYRKDLLAGTATKLIILNVPLITSTTSLIERIKAL